MLTLPKAIFMIENFSFRSGMSRHETALLFQSSSYSLFIHGSNGAHIITTITTEGNDFET
jgi:hypothetical protein